MGGGADAAEPDSQDSWESTEGRLLEREEGADLGRAEMEVARIEYEQRLEAER